MRKISTLTTAPLVVAALIAAGCGSSSKSISAGTSSAPASTPASTAASTAASNSGGAYGYGSSSSASTPATAPASTSGGAVVVSTKSSKLGTVLAGSKGLTVYLFMADKPGSSACSGACAQVWYPVTGAAHVGGQAIAADLGTITRSDGTTQVTYKGHPLYYYSLDKDSGDAYGQGIKSFGAEWYVLAPSGNKVDKS